MVLKGGLLLWLMLMLTAEASERDERGKLESNGPSKTYVNGNGNVVINVYHLDVHGTNMSNFLPMPLVSGASNGTFEKPLITASGGQARTGPLIQVILNQLPETETPLDEGDYDGSGLPSWEFENPSKPEPTVRIHTETSHTTTVASPTTEMPKRTKYFLNTRPHVLTTESTLPVNNVVVTEETFVTEIPKPIFKSWYHDLLYGGKKKGTGRDGDQKVIPGEVNKDKEPKRLLDKLLDGVFSSDLFGSLRRSSENMLNSGEVGQSEFTDQSFEKRLGYGISLRNETIGLQRRSAAKESRLFKRSPYEDRRGNGEIRPSRPVVVETSLLSKGGLESQYEKSFQHSRKAQGEMKQGRPVETQTGFISKRYLYTSYDNRSKKMDDQTRFGRREGQKPNRGSPESDPRLFGVFSKIKYGLLPKPAFSPGIVIPFPASIPAPAAPSLPIIPAPAAPITPAPNPVTIPPAPVPLPTITTLPTVSILPIDPLPGPILTTDSIPIPPTTQPPVVDQNCCATTSASPAYFSNPSYPSRDLSSPSTCTVTVIPQVETVCQLRVQFVVGNLLAPSDGVCLNQALSFSGTIWPLGVSSICGSNDGQHLYIHLDQSVPLSARFVNFVLRTAAPGQYYSMYLAIEQIDCKDPSGQAPPGCLQYFTSNSGSFSSFNFASAQSLTNTNYKICFSVPRQSCKIIFSSSPGQFMLEKFGSDQLVPYTLSGVSSKYCVQDYLLLPGGSADGELPTQDRFCGGALNPIHGSRDYQPVIAKVTGPVYVIEVHTGTPTTFFAPAHIGFSVRYSLLSTGCTSFTPQQPCSGVYSPPPPNTDPPITTTPSSPPITTTPSPPPITTTPSPPPITTTPSSVPTTTQTISTTMMTYTTTLKQSYGVPKPPTDSYGVPNPPSNSYGVPNAPSNSYGVPKPSYGVPTAPSNSYGIPPSSGYGVPSLAPQQILQPPQGSYGQPQQSLQNYGVPQSSYGIPQQNYGAPQQGGLDLTALYPFLGLQNSLNPFGSDYLSSIYQLGGIGPQIETPLSGSSSSAYQPPTPPPAYVPPSFGYGVPSSQSSSYGVPSPGYQPPTPSSAYGVPSNPSASYGIPPSGYGYGVPLGKPIVSKIAGSAVPSSSFALPAMSKTSNVTLGKPIFLPPTLQDKKKFTALSVGLLPPDPVKNFNDIDVNKYTEEDEKIDNNELKKRILEEASDEYYDD